MVKVLLSVYVKHTRLVGSTPRIPNGREGFTLEQFQDKIHEEKQWFWEMLIRSFGFRDLHTWICKIDFIIPLIWLLQSISGLDRNKESKRNYKSITSDFHSLVIISPRKKIPLKTSVCYPYYWRKLSYKKKP